MHVYVSERERERECEEGIGNEWQSGREARAVEQSIHAHARDFIFGRTLASRGKPERERQRQKKERERESVQKRVSDTFGNSINIISA